MKNIFKSTGTSGYLYIQNNVNNQSSGLRVANSVNPVFCLQAGFNSAVLSQWLQ